MHPELTVGAVGSFAPVETIVDCYRRPDVGIWKLNGFLIEYLKVVEDALRAVDPECTERVKKAITRFSEMLQSGEG